MAEYRETIRRTVLPNGMIIISEEMPDVESVAIGVWADAGSSDEGANEYGIAHFLEHMLFKGTANRDAYGLAAAIEDMGGYVDAYTERELTHVGARVLSEQLPFAIDILSEMLCHSTFPAEELERERQVIIEEIRKYEGVPEERIHDLIMEALWHRGALGHAILGNETSVQSFSRDDVAACWQRHFTPQRVIVTAAGKLHYDDFVARVSEAFEHLPRDGAGYDIADQGERLPLLLIDEEGEQINFTWGARAYQASDERVFPLALADIVLGASSTSRLFQEIREKRGLAYDIGSYLMGFRHTGLSVANGATSPALFPQVIALVRNVIKELRDNGITSHEWTRAKTQMKAALALSMEGTGDRMRRLAQHQLTWGEVYPLPYLLERIDTITIEDVQAVMDEVFDLKQWSFAAIGPVEEDDVRSLLGG